MKTAFVFLLSGFVLLLILKLSLNVVVRSSTIDVHIYDSYFIFDTKSLLTFICLFLAGLFFIGWALGTRRNVK